MESLLRAIISELVEHPEDVTIVPKRSPRGTILELKVHPDDTARVIGKQGRVINALRTLAKAAGTRDQARVYLNLISPAKPGTEGMYEDRSLREDRDGPRGPRRDGDRGRR